MLSVTYGIESLPKGDRYVALAEEAVQALTVSTNAGAYLGEQSLVCHLYHDS